MPVWNAGKIVEIWNAKTKLYTTFLFKYKMNICIFGSVIVFGGIFTLYSYNPDKHLRINEHKMRFMQKMSRNILPFTWFVAVELCIYAPCICLVNGLVKSLYYTFQTWNRQVTLNKTMRCGVVIGCYRM